MSQFISKCCSNRCSTSSPGRISSAMHKSKKLSRRPELRQIPRLVRMAGSLLSCYVRSGHSTIQSADHAAYTHAHAAASRMITGDFPCQRAVPRIPTQTQPMAQQITRSSTARLSLGMANPESFDSWHSSDPLRSHKPSRIPTEPASYCKLEFLYMFAMVRNHRRPLVVQFAHFDPSCF